LADKEDVIGRVLIVDQLASKKDRAAVDSLKQVLKADPFYGVRIEAARALRGIHTDEAFAALADCLDQSDARVRQQVLNAVTGFYRPEAYDIASKRLDQEKNPDILSGAIRALGAYARPEAREKLIGYLNSDSYRNELADAAIGALRAEDDSAFVEPLLKTLAERQSAFTSSGFGRGLGALAYLDRN